MARIQLARPWQNWLVTLFNYGMVILFALTLAYWIWVFFKPSDVPVTPPAPLSTQTLLPKILANHWFGENAKNESNIVTDLSSKLKLIGVMSTSKSQPGFAVFKLLDGTQQYALINQELIPGVKLESINADSVTVSQQGVVSKIELEPRLTAGQ